MLKTISIILAVFLAGLAGCGTPRNEQGAEKIWPLLNPTTINHVDYLSLYEAGLRSDYCLADEHINKSICYLSVGWDNEQEIWIDPPEGLLHVLADMKLILKPVSTMPGNKRGELIQHTVDGKWCHIFFVRIRNAIDENTIEIDMGYDSCSVITTAKRAQDGKWRFDAPYAIMHSNP